MMDYRLPLFAVILGLSAATAAAEELSGLVRIAGNAASSKVILTPESAFVGPRLCTSEATKRIRSLDSMVVKVKGSWQMPAGPGKCFGVTSFTVIKTPSGNDAVVGKLSQTASALQLVTEDGRSLNLTQVSDDLRKLIGKKVILDLKPSGNTTASAANTDFKALYFAEFP